MSSSEAKIILANVGSVIVTAINDFTETQLATEFFPTVPKEKFEDYRALYPTCFSGDRIDPFTYFCYVIRDEDQVILVDTGVGGGPAVGKHYNPEWTGHLLDGMAQAGIRAEDITAVVFTHIHGDHIGGATTLVGDVWEKTFPNARYLARKADYDAYYGGVTTGAFPAGCFEVCIQPLYDKGALELYDNQPIQISKHITLYAMPGHTPGSQCAVIHAGDTRCVLAGDCLAHPLQITDPEQDYVWDIDRPAAYQARLRILTDFALKGALLGGCHFGLGRIETQNGRRFWCELA